MKLRYAVFSYPDYYPDGGWNDFIAAFATLEEAETQAAAEQAKHLDTDIVDLEELKAIK